MATNYALIIRTLFELIALLNRQSGKTREELDAMYTEAKSKYKDLKDPRTLKKHEVDNG